MLKRPRLLMVMRTGKMSSPRQFLLGVLFGTCVSTMYLLRPCSLNKLDAKKSPIVFVGYERSICPGLKDVILTMETLNITIQRLLKYQEQMCDDVYSRFHALYSISRDVGSLELHPPDFKARLLGLLSNDEKLLEAAKQQEIIFLRNLWTDEEVIYNQLRAMRPSSPSVGNQESSDLEKLSEVTQPTCDFCNHTFMMGSDRWGRISHDLVRTMTNAFKLDALHGLVAPRSHHPTRWTWEVFQAMFVVAQQWFQKANLERPKNVYPSVWWDLLPSAGSSLVHPHMHLILNRHGYFGEQTRWLRAMERYSAANDASYFEDLLHVCTNLGLTYRHGRASAIISMTPRKDWEVVVLCPSLSDECIELIYLVLRVYIDKLHQPSFSLAMALPPMGKGANDHPMPVIVRMAPRGSGVPGKSDMTGLELFGASSINKDPFATARTIRRHLAELSHRGKDVR